MHLNWEHNLPPKGLAGRAALVVTTPGLPAPGWTLPYRYGNLAGDGEGGDASAFAFAEDRCEILLESSESSDAFRGEIC